MSRPYSVCLQEIDAALEDGPDDEFLFLCVLLSQTHILIGTE